MGTIPGTNVDGAFPPLEFQRLYDSEACPDSEVLEGLTVRGQDAQSDQENVRSAVKDWLSGLGY